ncbi:hypothetical protein D3C71_1059130 [compost metagenome]
MPILRKHGDSCAHSQIQLFTFDLKRFVDLRLYFFTQKMCDVRRRPAVRKNTPELVGTDSGYLVCTANHLRKAQGHEL